MMKRKPVAAMSAIFVLVTLVWLCACSQTAVVNPIERLPDLPALSERLGFEITGLSNLPGDTTQAAINLIHGEIGEISYIGRDEARDYEITYRMKKGSEKIDGVYTEYPDQREITVSGTAVSLRAQGEISYVANWEKEGVSYSLYVHEGVEDGTIASLLEGPLA